MHDVDVNSPLEGRNESRSLEGLSSQYFSFCTQKPKVFQVFGLSTKICFEEIQLVSSVGTVGKIRWG